MKSTQMREHAILEKLLRDLRIERGLTQRQMAELLDAPQSFISKYETGERRLDLIELRRVTAALQLGLAEFLVLFEEALENEA